MSGTAARQAGALIGSQTPRLIACLLALVIMVFSGSSSAHEVGSIGAFAIAKVILLQCNIAHRDNFVTWNNPHATLLREVSGLEYSINESCLVVDCPRLEPIIYAPDYNDISKISSAESHSVVHSVNAYRQGIALSVYVIRKHDLPQEAFFIWSATFQITKQFLFVNWGTIWCLQIYVSEQVRVEGKRMTNILKLEKKSDASLLSAEHQIRGHSCALFHPRALFGLHFQQLVPHSVPLPFGIGVSNNDGYQAYDSCSNQRHDLAKLPATLAMPLAIVLMLVSLCLGFYCANFTDYSIYGIAIFSMPPFALGLALFVFCLLPCPPPIFGFELVSTSQHSAPLHRFPEDIRVAPVVVPELELRNIQGKVFAADFAVLASFCQVRDNRHRKTESAA